jgi:hypothetical protein
VPVPPGMSNTRSSPAAIWVTPRPSEVAIPNIVPKIARMSTRLPQPVDLVADQRVQRRTDRHRQVVPEAEVGQRQPEDRVDRPGAEAPVVVGEQHRFPGRLLRGGHLWPLREVHDRLGDAPEHQPDPHAGAEQHREPGEVAEIRFGVVGPSLMLPDLPIATQMQNSTRNAIDEDHEAIRGWRDPVPDLEQHLFGIVGEDRPQATNSRINPAEIGNTTGWIWDFIRSSVDIDSFSLS